MLKLDYGNSPPVRVLVEGRIDRYDEYRTWIHDPKTGMEAKNFTQEQIREAERQIDEMQEFYEDLLEAL